MATINSENLFQRIKGVITFGFQYIFKIGSGKSFRNESGFTIGGFEVTVHGFMRDYRLLSKIPPHLWINGGERAIEYYEGDAISGGDEEIIGNSMIQIVTSNSSIMNTPLTYTNNNKRMVTKKPADLHQSPDNVDQILLSPKQVYVELKTVPNPFTLENIDAKVSTYAKLQDLIRVDASRGNKETIKDVLQRLRNRQQYAKSTKIQKFFGKFKNTTDELVTELLEKHTHLKIGPADDFIAEFPIDAHETMIAYSDAVVSLCGDKPVFYLIAKKTDFKTKEGARKKRDPILLAQSPFGMYWQILGAWEEEMSLVNDL